MNNFNELITIKYLKLFKCPVIATLIFQIGDLGWHYLRVTFDLREVNLPDESPKLLSPCKNDGDKISNLVGSERSWTIFNP